MRALLAGVLLLLAACAAAPPRDARAARLDALFAGLRAAPDEAAARALEARIWALWLQTGDPAIDAPMARATAAMRAADFEGALAILEALSRSHPDYPEAWNQQATIHFALGRYEESLAAIARTLALEPRHFGALAGRGLIRLRQGDSALANRNFLEALKIDPFLRERALVQGGT